MNPKRLIDDISRQEAYKELLQSKERVIGINGLAGSAFSVAVSYYAANMAGVHTLVAGSKDEAGYLTNDLEELFGGENVYFFPSGYKKSILYGQESSSGMVHRTALLERLSNIKKDETIIICTYPEALAEKVASGEDISGNSISLKRGDKI